MNTHDFKLGTIFWDEQGNSFELFSVDHELEFLEFRKRNADGGGLSYKRLSLKLVKERIIKGFWSDTGPIAEESSPNRPTLPEREFKAGEMVWYPDGGFQVLQETTNPERLRIRFQGDCYRDGRFGKMHESRTLLTLEEAALLGLKPPKKKVKKTISIWIVVDSRGHILWTAGSQEHAVVWKDSWLESLDKNSYSGDVQVVCLTAEIEVDDV